MRAGCRPHGRRRRWRGRARRRPCAGRARGRFPCRSVARVGAGRAPPTLVFRDGTHPGGGRVRRPQQRARHLLRLGRQRSAPPGPRPVRRRPGRHRPGRCLGARHRRPRGARDPRLRIALGGRIRHRGGPARRPDPRRPPAEVDRLGLPVFVKPARAGSSVGITRVTHLPALDAAIAAARTHAPKVLVEAEVVGREVECGVLEFPDGSVRASLPAEIRIVGAGADYYDFDAKYLDDVCEFDIPAKLDDEVTERVRETAVAAFRALDCQGLARVDFFVGTDGVPTVNEVNTMPGFTPISMFPRMWAVTGLDYPALLSTLVDTAL